MKEKKVTVKVWELDTWWKKGIYIIGWISLILIIIGFPTSCINTWGTSFTEEMQQSDNSIFISEYNSKLEHTNNLIAEHDNFINEINLKSTDAETKLKIMRDYIAWTDAHMNEFINFKLYIESNHKKLEQADVNPDYVRSNVVSVIEVMQGNKQAFSIYV